MAVRYNVIERLARARQVIERSVFIASAYPVKSREEALSIIKAVKNEFLGANHNVPAMIIGGDSRLQWASDDGEPSGTAGAPILKLLASEGLSYVLVVVTRYFGGIKLGTGGLVRAYTSSAKLALRAAGKRAARDIVRLGIALPYQFENGLRRMAKDIPFELCETKYTDNFTAYIECIAEKEQQLLSSVLRLTAGKSEILFREEKIR